MKTKALLLSVLFLASMSVFTLLSCSNPSLSDVSPELSAVPAPPSLSVAGGHSALHSERDLLAARKAYINVFFRLMARERRVAAWFFTGDATLKVTSYEPDRVPLAGDYTGTRAVGHYLSSLYSAVDFTSLEVQYQLAQGDYVSTHVGLKAEIVSSGSDVDMNLVYLFHFGKNGRIDQCRVYYDTQVWTRAFSGQPGELFADIREPDEDFSVQSSDYDVAAKVDLLYDYFYAGNIPEVLKLLSPDAAVYFKGDQQTYPYAGSYEGTDEILQFVANLAGTAAPYNIERFTVSEGDKTDMVLFEEWTVFATGKSYHVNTVNSWKINPDGLLLGFSNYPDSLEIEQAYKP